jgi:hypothetical protein
MDATFEFDVGGAESSLHQTNDIRQHAPVNKFNKCKTLGTSFTAPSVSAEIHAWLLGWVIFWREILNYSAKKERSLRLWRTRGFRQVGGGREGSSRRCEGRGGVWGAGGVRRDGAERLGGGGFGAGVALTGD